MQLSEKEIMRIMSGEAFMDKDWDSPPTPPSATSTSSSGNQSPSPSTSSTSPNSGPHSANNNNNNSLKQTFESSQQSPNGPPSLPSPHKDPVDVPRLLKARSSEASETVFPIQSTNEMISPSQIPVSFNSNNFTSPAAPFNITGGLFNPTSFPSYPRIPNPVDAPNFNFANPGSLNMHLRLFNSNSAASWQNLLASTSLARNFYNYQNMLPTSTAARGLPPLLPQIPQLPFLTSNQQTYINGNSLHSAGGPPTKRARIEIEENKDPVPTTLSLSSNMNNFMPQTSSPKIEPKFNSLAKSVSCDNTKSERSFEDIECVEDLNFSAETKSLVLKILTDNKEDSSLNFEIMKAEIVKLQV